MGILAENPGLLRQVMCWHLSHCILVIFLEHGWFKEYEIMRGIYNRLLHPEQGEQHFTVWGRGHFHVRRSACAAVLLLSLLFMCVGRSIVGTYIVLYIFSLVEVVLEVIRTLFLVSCSRFVMVLGFVLG